MRLLLRLLFRLVTTLVKAMLRSAWLLGSGREPVAYVNLTHMPLDTSAVLPSLRARGYPLPRHTQWQIGGGGYSITTQSVVIEGEGGGGGMMRAQGAYHTRGGAGHGSATLGYAFRLGPLRFFPFAGAGGGGGGALIAETDGEAPRDADLTRYPYIAFASGGPRLVYGLGADLWLGGRIGLVIGVRLGYARDLVALSSETLDGQRSALRLRMGGGQPYFRLIAGVGKGA